MFTAKKLVVYVSEEKLKAGWAVLAKEPRLGGVEEYLREGKKLTEILEKIKTDFKYEKASFVFSDELSYILRFEIPKEEKNLKEYIKEKIKEGIPEILETACWDFREFKEEGVKKVEIFAPIKDTYEQLVRAAKKVGFAVETVEAAALSATRHSEPMLGVVLGGDFLKKEESEERPNVVVLEEKAWQEEEDGEGEEEEETEEEEENEGEEVREEREEERELELEEEEKPMILESMSGSESQKKTPVFLIILVLVIGTAGVFLVSRMITKRQFPAKPTPVPTPSEEAPSPTPKPELGRELIKIKVLNGSGEPGAAGKGKEFLEALGYSEVETGNASSYDYKETEIALRKEKAEYFDLLYEDLSDEYLVAAKQAVLQEDSDYDAVITLGEKAAEEKEEEEAEESEEETEEVEEE